MEVKNRQTFHSSNFFMHEAKSEKLWIVKIWKIGRFHWALPAKALSFEKQSRIQNLDSTFCCWYALLHANYRAELWVIFKQQQKQFSFFLLYDNATQKLPICNGNLQKQMVQKTPCVSTTLNCPKRWVIQRKLGLLLWEAEEWSMSQIWQLSVDIKWSDWKMIDGR